MKERAENGVENEIRLRKRYDKKKKTVRMMVMFR